MSVIQNIRDKYARWAVIAIAVSLLGFILMDAFAGRTGLFSNSRSTTVGKIDGESIEFTDFSKKVSAAEEMERQQGMESNLQQEVDGVWEQEVNDVLLSEQYKKLGLSVSTKEINSMLFSPNAPEDFKKAFTNPQTGVFDPNAARDQINRIKKQGTADDKNRLAQYIESIQKQMLMAKYNALLSNSMYFPKWLLEKRNADNSLLAKVSYVAVPYSTIADSTVKVSDGEIEDYIKDHKKDFEQKEETRSINYVLFSARPNAADSAAARTSLLQLKAAFDTAKNYDEFARRNNSLTPFYNSFISKKALQMPNKDSILSAPVGVVYGPYLDVAQGQSQNAAYALSKIIDEKQIPDTVKIRHILIATTQQNPQTGETVQVRDDSTAKRLVDSVQRLLKSGTSFDTLAAKFSDDPGSKTKGGVYDNVTTGRMVPEFNDYIFTHKTGDVGVVKTPFGYHLIEILSQKGSSPGYKIAYVSRPISASQETDNQASNDANMFAGDSRDLKSFNANWESKLKSKGINKLVAADIKPMDFTINGVTGQSRRFIKNIFDAGKGDVVGPERVGDDYVVAIVTDVTKPGFASVASARAAIEPILRNRKKAEVIKKNLGTVSTLEQAATKSNQQIQTADSLRFSGGNSALGYEPKVIGAAFNPSNKGKVVNEALAGQAGVYVIRVENVSSTPIEAANIDDQRRMLEMQARQQLMYNPNAYIYVLRKGANIKDNRARFY